MPESLLRPAELTLGASEHDRCLSPTDSIAPSESTSTRLGQHGYEPWLFQTMLDELSVGELRHRLHLLGPRRPGERYALDDVVLVLVHESFGTQMFRAGGQGRAGRHDRPARHRPGRLLRARRRARGRADAVRTACQLALSAAPGALPRGPRPPDQHRQPPDLRQRPAGVRRAQRPLRLGLHAGARSTSTASRRSTTDCGHAFGDDLLRQFGFALRRSVRSGDIAARIGGDEFAVISEQRRRARLDGLHRPAAQQFESGA